MADKIQTKNSSPNRSLLTSNDEGLPENQFMVGDDLASRIGFGESKATQEEEAFLQEIMNGVEDAIHGKYNDNLVQAVASAPDLWQGVSMATKALVERSYFEAEKKGVQPPSSVYLGKGGAIQQTLDLVWEVANAAEMPGSGDERQRAASYFNTLKMLGETMFEESDDSALEAQQMLINAEFGRGTTKMAEQGIAEQAERSGYGSEDIHLFGG